MQDIFSSSRSILGDYVLGFGQPFMALEGIGQEIMRIISAGSLLRQGYRLVSEGILIHVSASVDDRAVILAPTIISAGAEIRPFAYIRGRAVIGEGAVIGNSTELKNTIAYDGVQLPHFNYAGDSILGFKVHFGAGAIASNTRSDGKSVVLKAETPVDTGLRKCGAFCGSMAEIGCGSVLNPGTVIGPSSRVYPLSSVRTFVPAHCIFKADGSIVPMAEA